MNEQVIAGAVQEINGRIQELTAARDGLLKLLPQGLAQLGTETPAAPSKPARGDARPTSVRSSGRSSRMATNGRGRRASSKIQVPSSEPESSGDTRSSTLSGKVATVAGAMKVQIASLGGKEFTTDELRQALEAKHGNDAFWKDASGSALNGNLSYWASKGRLEKTPLGYRAIDAEFFANVEY